MNTSILCILLFTKLFFSQFTRSWIKTRSMSPSEQLMSSGKSVCARARFVKRNIAHTRATHTHDTHTHTYIHTHTHIYTHTHTHTFPPQAHPSGYRPVDHLSVSWSGPLVVQLSRM